MGVVFLDTGRQPEVADLYFHFFGEKHVAELEVSVNDTPGMSVLYTFGKLQHEVPYFGLS